MSKRLRSAVLAILCLLVAHMTFGQNGTWTMKSSMLMPHLSGSSAVIDGELYWAGDASSNPSIGTDVEVYDPTNDSWSLVATFSTPYVAYGLGVSVGEKFYVQLQMWRSTTQLPIHGHLALPCQLRGTILPEA